jgi:hypothetical protein
MSYNREPNERYSYAHGQGSARVEVGFDSRTFGGQNVCRLSR